MAGGVFESLLYLVETVLTGVIRLTADVSALSQHAEYLL